MLLFLFKFQIFMENMLDQLPLLEAPAEDHMLILHLSIVACPMSCFSKYFNALVLFDKIVISLLWFSLSASNCLLFI